ncbi:17-beta-hydroxysteroid dehydrogenase type 1 [Lepisosteus oculatus]|uniref:17-beta-hydroxysteroid dehydrogenase type 1 n=1 Tax=Lepisosteus oculatus TaxID=7918 RepID=UPI00371C2F01
MDKTVVLITGCSSGIGLRLAVHLASDPSKTFKVYATMRNLAKKRRLMDCVKDVHPDTMDILQMDVTDQLSVLNAKEKIEEKRVDILVCNAGVGLMGPLEAQSYETMTRIFDVNLFGTIRSIQAFLPGMKARRSGRILVTGSLGGLQGLPFNEVYCASKFAVEGVCESLAILLQQFNVHVSLIECGPVNTDFIANLRRAEAEDVSLRQVDARTLDLYQLYLQHCDSIFQDAAQDTADIVKVFLDVIRADSPALRYYTSTALMPLSTLKLALQDGSQYVRTMSKIIFSANQTEDA